MGKWSLKEKRDFFNSLSPTDQYIITKCSVGWFFNSEKENAPARVYICGTDDCSYTKYFASEQEAKEELVYLRNLQPLDFRLDILDRGYLFTN